MNLNQNAEPLRFSLNDKKTMLKDFSNTIDVNKRFDNNAARVANILTGKESKSNKDSRTLITRFLQDIDVEALSAVFILAGTAITSAIKFYRTMRKLNEDTPIDMYEPIDDFDIDSDKLQELFESTEFKNLNESNQQSIQEEIKDVNIKKILDETNNQFHFDSGYFMESINSNKLSDIQFSLKYHKNNTNNFNDFLNSVVTFVNTANVQLTDMDIQRLEKHYQKYK